MFLTPIKPEGGGSPPSLLTWLSFGAGEEPGVEEKSHDKSLSKRAVRCDMCKPATRRACACSTGAALRVAPGKFLDYASGAEA
jgi:hypothetical protein